jgi:16S rRNA G966 N2-methylase RsmD
VELVRGDALEFVRGHSISAGLFDVIFLDPPFDADYWARLASLLPPLLARDARVYCEAGVPVEWSGSWEIVKQGRAGQVTYQLLKRTEE